MCSISKVLIITPFFYPNKGGAETFCEDLAKALSKKYVVHISTIKWTKPIIWQGNSLKEAIKMLWKLTFPTYKLIKKYKYEKIYALGLIPSLICFLINVKFSTIMLALYDFKERNLIVKFILNKAQKIFVEGERGKQDIISLGIKDNKIIKFQHWCDQNRFFYKPKNNEKLKVLFVGRPIKIKGKHIVEQCEALTEGIDYEYITDVPYADLQKYYQMADVCIVPSLYPEGFSRVVIEAASCGCALLTSNKGALPEMVSPFGKVVDPTPENFADYLNKLNKHKSALEKIQLCTTQYALKNFNEKNAEIFI